MDHLQSYLESLSRQHVLVIGDSMLDRYITGHVSRISPEAPVPVLLMEDTIRKIGGAANVALNVKALGARATLLSTIGKDVAGETFLESMLEARMKTSHILQTDRKSTVKTRIMSDSQHLLRVDEEDSSPVPEQIQSRLIEQYLEIIREDTPTVIILQDYNKGLLTPAFIDAILSAAKTSGIPVCVDPKLKNFFAYKGVRIFKPNLAEVRAVVPFEVSVDLFSLDQSDAYLRKELQHTLTIITLGKDGIYLNDGSYSEIIPTESRDIVDVCGAGDAVIASVSLSAAGKYSLPEIGRIGNLAGGLVCEYVGVTPIPYQRFVDEFMRK